MSAEVQTYPQSQKQIPRYPSSKFGFPALANMPGLIQSEIPTPFKNETIARSMSRYRGNRRVKTQVDSLPIPLTPSHQRQPRLPQSSPNPYNESNSPSEPSVYRAKQNTKPNRDNDSNGQFAVEGISRQAVARPAATSYQPRAIRSDSGGQKAIQRSQQTDASTAKARSREFFDNPAQREARYGANEKDQAQAQLLLQEQTDSVRMREAILEEPRWKELDRTYDISQKRQSLRLDDRVVSQPVTKSKEMGFLQQEHTQKQTALRPILSPKKSFTKRMAGTISKAAGSDSRAELKRTISFPIPIEPESVVPTSAPGFDAPISAVNAGDRRVMVKCQDNVVLITITPSTTPVDVIRFASSKMAGLIDPNSVVLLESFKQVGLERPLRRYEHIRDMLNSWDSDEQNTLIIVPSPTGGKDDDLDLGNVPREQPGDTLVYLHHSQMPGKWDKRWVTLRSDGQVVIAKSLGGESTNICHMSDFDIYVPTPRQMAKKIKPPKKVCFAVKSQQKSSMFMSAANFVHFFSTSDKKLAASWYKAVQEWRSWYLVNIMGEGQKQATNTGNTPTANGVHRRNSIKAPLAADREQYTANSRQDIPLTAAPAIGAVGLAQSNHTKVRPVRDRGAPPVSFPKKLTKDATTGGATTRKHGPALIQSNPEQVPQPEPFEPTSLLGRTYSQRQKVPQSTKPLTAHNHVPSIPPSTTAMNFNSSFKHTTSQHQQPKPLVDLTPTYVEPPQHSRKGRGIIPDQLPPGGLVDIATSPEIAIPIPPTTSWRRPREESPTAQRTHTLRGGRPTNLSSSESLHTSPERSAYHHDDAAAFTGSGLLAKTGKSQGGTGTGRGVMSGDRQAKGPMLDVAEPSQFAQGSLLAAIEEPESGVVIDREKRRTVNVMVGEGM